ncbi:MAG: protease inhibitor I42 family protein [Anaerolineales bacterium]
MFGRLQATLFFILSPVLFQETGSSSTRVQLTMHDNGRHVTLHVGDILAIGLEANPSTGYTWKMVQQDPSLLGEQGTAQFKAASTGLVGAPGIQTLIFKALKAGETTLTLGYLRSWESGVPPINTFQITVTIQ